MTQKQGVDVYTRLMAALFDERSLLSVKTGFQSLFGNPLNGSQTIFSPDSLLVDIDIVRGTEKTAALIRRGSLGSNENSKTTVQEEYTSITREYPLGEEKDVITANQLLKRIAGQNPYMQLTKAEKTRILAEKYHNEHIRRFVRLNERLASQSVVDGVQDGILDTANVNLQYDFRRNAQNFITPAIKWDQATATIMADVDDACDVARINGKINPDFALVGGGAMQAMIDSTKFQDQADNRRFELIMVSDKNPVPSKFARMIESGFHARGRLLTAKGYEVWLFTYVDGYEAAGGGFVKYMPEDKVIIGSSSSRNDRYFGPSEHMAFGPERIDIMAREFGIKNPASMSMPDIAGASDVVSPLMFHYDCYAHGDNKGIVCRTQSSAIFATTQTDSWVTLEGLLTP